MRREPTRRADTSADAAPDGRPGPRVRPEARREGPAGLDGVVEGKPLPADLLVGLVALPGDDHHVARARRIERQADGHAPVGLDHDAAGWRRPPGIPASTSSMMASGSSSRGLSDVRNARSLSCAAAAPISGRLARSRFPPQPKTQSTRPDRRQARASPSTTSSPAGVCA